VQCYIPKTRSLIDADTVEFFPHSIPFPSFTLTDFLVQAATDITSILVNPPKSIVPTIQAGDPVKNAILNKARLLKRADKIPQLKDIEETPLPRVQSTKSKETQAINTTKPHIIPFEQNKATPTPQINEPPVTIQVLSTTSLPKNCRYQNILSNQYNLRSKHHLI